jgi:hypothetical protein
MSDTGRITNSEFKSFNCILDFIEQLKEAICTNDKVYHEVALYNHLIHKVKITNKQNIRRHISLFGEFCSRNQDAIIKKDPSLIVFNIVKYSDKIYINLKNILSSLDIDDDIKKASWDHLLAIHASIDPSSKARSVLMGLTESKVPEEQMIGGLIGEISKHVDVNDDRNPMAIFNSLMQSGVVNKMMSSLDNSVKKGDVDMNKLGTTIQGMMSGLMNAMGGMNNSSGSVSSSDSTESNSSGLDLGNMLSSMMGLMSNSGGSGFSGTNPELIRQQLEKQLEEEMKKESNQNSVPTTEPTPSNTTNQNTINEGNSH